MVKVHEYTRHTKLPNADYVLESCEALPDIIKVLTPKFEGTWDIVLLDIKISEAKDLLTKNNIPDFVNVSILLSPKKLSAVLLEFPSYAEKTKSVYDVYKEMIAELEHPIDKKAASYIYNAVGRDIDELRKTLLLVDKSCTGSIIILSDVQKELSYTKRIYTNQVLTELLTHSRYFKAHYVTWKNELGLSYAYNSLYKQTTLLVKDKNKYLHNEDIKNPIASKADGVSIALLYLLFTNSTSYFQLDSIVYQFQNLTTKSVHNIVDTYLKEL